ncbi:hypothetical protein N824_08015 [Pedobacter sp. V48]|nr:hypothetical protein N824_08015 [Pedobacter sp. V48]
MEQANGTAKCCQELSEYILSHPMAVQAASYFYTAWYSVEFEKTNFLKWHIYQTKLTNYKNLRFVMPGGHAFLKRNYNRALRIAFKIGDAY